MRFTLSRDQVATGNVVAQPIAGGHHLQSHVILPTEIAHRFTQHRQNMGPNIQNDAVRVTKRTLIRLAGGKIERYRFSGSVEPAWLWRNPSMLTISEKWLTSANRTAPRRAIQ